MPAKGSPIKGRVKRKNTSPMKKTPLFFAWILVPHRTCFTYFAPVTAFLLVRGSIYADPHQSPTRFKAVML